MTRLLTPTSILLTVILLAVNIPALAVDRTFQIEVENSLKGTVPSNWWLHASWRDQTLVVFVSPPTQESFDLWYDTPRQKETLENLCKAIPGLGLNVPIASPTTLSENNNLCGTSPCNLDSADANSPHTVVKFTFKTPSTPGSYRWQCFVPCGLGYVDGNGGPMGTPGYMMGEMEVQA